VPPVDLGPAQRLVVDAVYPGRDAVLPRDGEQRRRRMLREVRAGRIQKAIDTAEKMDEPFWDWEPNSTAILGIEDQLGRKLSIV
jgi:hypothetical protein